MTIRTADDFVDSIGINTHFSYVDAVYHLNFPMVKQALLDLGVRHYREGMHTYPDDFCDLMNELGDAGLGCNYLLDPRLADEVVIDYANRVNNLESIENWNEPDMQGGSDWVAPLQEVIPRLKKAGDNMPTAVIGPSLVNPAWWDDATNSHMLLGDVSEHIHRNNIHNYFGAYHPETKGWGGGCDEDGYCYGSIRWAVKQAQISGPGLATWTTENGYTINANKPDTSVPEEIFARYIPRLLLEQWNEGIERTFIYQLADDPSTACCMGLMDDKGNRRKPFKAVQNLIKLLSDKGDTFEPKPFEYMFSVAPSTLHTTLLAKRDKSYWLAMWLGVSGYDPHSHELKKVTPVKVAVNWVGNTYGSRQYKFDDEGSYTELYTEGNSVEVSVDDKLLLLKMAMK